MALNPEEQIYYDETTGQCKCFSARDGKALIVNVDEPLLYNHYTSKVCYKGNTYAPYCSFCPKELCLYYKPEVNMVPEGEAKTVIMSSDEVTKYKASKLTK